MRRQRVVDAFLFSDELDMLELRLSVLDPVVDRFVLVESTVTFSGLEKPLAFADHRERFAAWHDKITHVVVRDTPDTGSWRWGRERHQRNQLLRGLVDCRCDDLVLVSDVDEIPDPEAVGRRLRGGYHQEFMLYYLNCRHMSEYWVGTVALYAFQLAVLGAQTARDRRYDLERVERGGWHFAYAISPEAMRAKLRAFSHAEFDTEEHAGAFEHRRAALTDVFAVHQGTLTVLDLDAGYFPAYLKANRERYAHLLRSEPGP
jgi:beta-1,4-mannosyl-glycoprotein beta-1,4-N-acetylglucosaminyltransferase